MGDEGAKAGSPPGDQGHWRQRGSRVSRSQGEDLEEGASGEMSREARRAMSQEVGGREADAQKAGNNPDPAPSGLRAHPRLAASA